MLITRSRQLLSLAGWLVLLAGVLYLHVGEYIMTFCLGGFFPGTSIEVSPLQAMCISSAAVILIGCWALLGVRTRRTLRMRHYGVRRPIVVRQSRVFAAQMAGHDATDLARRRQVSALLPSLSRQVRDAAGLAAALLLQGFLWTLIGFGRVMVLMIDATSRTGHGTKRTGLRSWHATSQTMSDFMQWLEPHLWSADAWVEMHYRQGERWSGERLSRHESMRVMKTMVDGWSARSVAVEVPSADKKS